MDFWNRIVVALVAVLVIAVAVIIILVTSEVVDPDFLPGTGADAWFFQQFDTLANYSNGAKGTSIGIAVGVGVVMLGVLFLELRTLRRPEEILPVSNTHYVASTDESSGHAGGLVNIEASSVRLLAERTGIANRQVHSIRCRLGVRSKPPGGPANIVINCYPRLELGSDVQEVSDDLRTRIQETVEKRTGLKVIQVNVARVRYSRGDENRLLGS